MLEKLTLSALVVPFLRVGNGTKRTSAATHSETVSSQKPEVPATDVATHKPVAEPVAKPVAAPLLPERVAIEQFCREMVAGWGGVDLEVATVHRGYIDMCSDRGWPELTVKALSGGLVALGCQRRQLDLRKTGEGRPTVIVFPKALVSRRAAPAKQRSVKKKGSPRRPK